MTPISSFLPSATSTASTGSVKKTPTAYDINAQEFGPVAATAIGVAAQATDVASSSASFSAEGMKRLAQMAGSAVDSVEGAVSKVGDELSSFGHGIENDVKKAYHAVLDAGSSVVSGVEDAVDSVENSISHVASSIGDAFTSAKNEVTSATSSVASYATLGLNALA